jgi:hypothetical protein
LVSSPLERQFDVAEPRDTTHERWTFDDQRILQDLGEKAWFQLGKGRLIGSFPDNEKQTFVWIGEYDKLINYTKCILDRHPDNETCEKLYRIMVAQKIRGL